MPADLNELLGFSAGHTGEMTEWGAEIFLDCLGCSHVDRRRNHVVGGLPRVDVIAGMHGLPRERIFPSMTTWAVLTIRAARSRSNLQT